MKKILFLLILIIFSAAGCGQYDQAGQGGDDIYCPDCKPWPDCTDKTMPGDAGEQGGCEDGETGGQDTAGDIGT